ncbi:MAG: PqqD family protein [Planctomycetota bacterium]|nr:PqqD family protein [Planctomycetota bacterium]
MPNLMHEDVLVEAVAQQASAVFDGEAVVLQLEQGMYFGLNEVGTFIWEAIQTRHYSLKELCTEVARVYDVDPADCQDDVQAFVDTLLEKELIRVIHAQPV